MNKYEIMFIVRPDMEEAEIRNTAENMKKVLTDKKATILDEKAMGQRELAYEIKKFNTGYYYLFVVEANKEAEEEFNRVARINENLLRHLIVKVEEDTVIEDLFDSAFYGFLMGTPKTSEETPFFLENKPFFNFHWIDFI